jgi:exonuclease SbcD
MIRILHTADWHLGQNFFGYDRMEEQEHFLVWLSDQIKARDVDVLVVAGDVFDVSNPSAVSQRMFYRFIRRATAASPRLQMVIVAGNHDSAARLEAPVPLLHELNTTVKGLVHKYEGVIDPDDLIVELKNRAGEVEAFCLAVPYLRQGDYPVVETEGNPYAEGVKALYRQLTEHVLERKTPGQAIIAVGHLQATGSEIAEKDYSERTVIGGLECISPESFSSEIAYAALGHIHKAQCVSGRENIRYAGSPISMSFAEKHYHHGVVEVVLADGRLQSIEKVEYTPLVSMLSVPAGQAAGPDEVLGQLGGLPLRTDENSHEPAPYLEVKVLLDEPEPMLRQQIEDAIAGKQVRLARIVSVYRNVDPAVPGEEVMRAGLQEMTPSQIVRSTFEKIYQTDMPEELLRLFREAELSTINSQ